MAMKFGKKTGGEESWKAVGFINITLPGANGKRIKVGAIVLHEENDNEQALCEKLIKDPEYLDVVIKNLEFTFNENNKGSVGFSLSEED